MVLLVEAGQGSGHFGRFAATGTAVVEQHAGEKRPAVHLLARYAGNASLAAAVLGTGVRTVRRHCRGWPPPPGLRLRRALHRRVVELACLWCLSEWNRRARRIGKPCPCGPARSA